LIVKTYIEELKTKEENGENESYPPLEKALELEEEQAVEIEAGPDALPECWPQMISG